MPQRVALVVSSTEELKQRLEAILNGGSPNGTCRGRIQKSLPGDGEAEVRGLLERRELSRLAALWVSGGKIDWSLLYQSALPRRISAPTYPFARERHWFQETGNVSRERPQIGAAQLHPLV